VYVATVDAFTCDGKVSDHIIGPLEEFADLDVLELAADDRGQIVVFELLERPRVGGFGDCGPGDVVASNDVGCGPGSISRVLNSGRHDGNRVTAQTNNTGNIKMIEDMANRGGISQRIPFTW